jgi:hypothetical protein
LETVRFVIDDKNNIDRTLRRKKEKCSKEFIKKLLSQKYFEREKNKNIYPRL